MEVKAVSGPGMAMHCCAKQVIAQAQNQQTANI